MKLVDSGVNIIFGDLPDVDPTTPEGRMFIQMFGSYAEFEKNRIGTRTRECSDRQGAGDSARRQQPEVPQPHGRGQGQGDRRARPGGAWPGPSKNRATSPASPRR